MHNTFRFIEVVQNIKQHKSRNVLTGFGVAWGIFVLIILLSSGEGLRSGVNRVFSGYAQNSMWIYGGQSSIIDKGNTEGKPVIFSQNFLEKIKRRFDEIDYISPEISLPQHSFVCVKDKSQVSTIKGVGKDYFKIKLLELESGRIFNNADEQTERPVCIIGSQLKEILFPLVDPIGDNVCISGAWYKIIGVLSKGTLFTKNEEQSVFITLNCFRKSYGQALETNVFGILLKNNVNTEKIEKKLKKFLSLNLGFDLLDHKALNILNCNESVKSFNKLFDGLNLFLWLVGACLLLSGIVGIGNMMMVVVKERTKEIGIRKSIGATPNEILVMILAESVLITTVSGMIGMVSGFILVGVANWIIHLTDNKEDALISSLQVNVPMALGSIVLLIIAGCLAGFIPAKRATEIVTLEALNREF